MTQMEKYFERKNKAFDFIRLQLALAEKESYYVAINLGDGSKLGGEVVHLDNVSVSILASGANFPALAPLCQIKTIIIK